MARLAFTTPFSGQAEDAHTALTDPRVLISRPVFLHPNGTPLANAARWALPNMTVDGNKPDSFKDFLAERSLFVIGGFQFIVEMGLKATWYCHDATRHDARRLIHQRGWSNIFTELKGHENKADDLFGQGSIHEFFQNSPAILPEEDAAVAKPKVLSPKEAGAKRLLMRKKHILRLRKAIEFVVLTEAILAYRFKKGYSKNRFYQATKLPTAVLPYPEVVWDYLWFEPAHYCVSTPARSEDIREILNRQELVTRFREASGQRDGALYWTLQGAPGKYKTIAATCTVLNAVYSGLAQTNVRTALPNEYRQKLKLFDEKASIAHIADIEFIPELGV